MSSEVFFVQRNFAVGDLAANCRILKESADAAAAVGAEVVLAPELALTGYPPEDLLNDESFLLAAKNEAECLALAVNPSLAVVFGLPWREGEKLYNAAVLVRDGRIEAVAKKTACLIFRFLTSAVILPPAVKSRLFFPLMIMFTPCRFVKTCGIGDKRKMCGWPPPNTRFV